MQTHKPKKPLRRKDAYTTADIGRICCMSSTKAYRLIDKGVIPSFRIPGGLHRRSTHEQLAAFLASDPSLDYARKRLEALPE